ncbi:MAG: ABC transporter ATP-binding protein [Planctomycetes bacterium]|nr:ABC transporter ATP-binding protein [Planctomycetota bacterium]MCH9727773.1 ABC transporter ATP-binding protein [Planctomycetota bacterium]MCH9776368.1 ABC transporter ATP-binding protein [Planctomycetota bacterium]MCH9789996.1 ABC transporter ATP-binding protein [Planctomycetota bacterium]
MSTQPPMVEVKNLWVRYGKYEAVKGISFSIPKGEVFGFIGPNGAGKSSTIKVLATLQREYQCDTVKINGISLNKAPHLIREIIGYMPDFFGVYEDLTAREYLHFFAAAYRIDRKKRKAIVNDVLELTDLTGKIDAPVDSLSRGMKQRLALARVLLHDPDLLLLDEPASGLDPRARIEVRELLVALKEMGKTIIISSHILHELSQLCTSIGIIEAGEFVTQGSLDHIYKRLELSRVVHVQIVGEMNGVCENIEAMPGVKSVTVQADRLAIQLQEDQLAVEDLHAKLAATGVKIRMFQAEAMDMETVFMKLTEGKTA